MKNLNLKEDLNQWYLLIDASTEGKKTSCGGARVLAYMITDYYCDMKTHNHIIKVRQLYKGEFSHDTMCNPSMDDPDSDLYEPVPFASVVAFLL